MVRSGSTRLARKCLVRDSYLSKGRLLTKCIQTRGLRSRQTIDSPVAIRAKGLRAGGRPVALQRVGRLGLRAPFRPARPGIPFASSRCMRPLALLPILALLTLGHGHLVPLAAKPSRAGTGDSPWTQMRNVHFVVDPQVILEVRELHGRLAPTRKGAIPIFDDPKSFRIEIDRATTALSTASLGALLNRYTFNYPGAPLKNIEVSVHDGKLRQKGTLHKGADVPFEMDGELSALPDGRLKVHPTALKVAGLP